MKQGIQTNWAGNDEIKKSGCYFLCLVQKAVFEGHCSVDPLPLVEGWYDKAIMNNFMNVDCYVNSAVDIYNMIAKKQAYLFLSPLPKVPPKKDAWNIACLKKKGYTHFVLHHINESGEIDDIWDSLDPKRPAAREYVLDSYRVLI